MFTVIETANFEKNARQLLSEEEYVRLIMMLAENPEAGSLIKGTGGARKTPVRDQSQGQIGRRTDYPFLPDGRRESLFAGYLCQKQQGGPDKIGRTRAGHVD